VAISTAWI